MNDLLSVIVDFNLEFLATTPQLNFPRFTEDLSLFLSCYHLQSSMNQFRIYLALPHDSFLFFPLEEMGDLRLIKRFAYADMKAVISDRLF